MPATSHALTGEQSAYSEGVVWSDDGVSCGGHALQYYTPDFACCQIHSQSQTTGAECRDPLRPHRKRRERVRRVGIAEGSTGGGALQDSKRERRQPKSGSLAPS